MTEFTPVNAWADPPTTISVHVDTGDSQINVASLPPGVPIGPCAFPVLVMDNRDPRLATTTEQMLVTNVGGAGNLVWDVTRVYGSDNPGSAQTHEIGDDVYLNQTIESLRGMGVVDAPVQSTQLKIGQDWGLTGAINISITSNQNDWNPSGFADASHILLTTDASRNITGLVAPSYPRRVLIENVGSFNFVLKGQDAGSSAANRFAGSDVTVGPGQSIEIIHDPTVLTRWVVIGGVGGSSLSFAAPSAEAIGSSQATGSASTVNHSDHVHAMPGFAVPSAEAVGSSQATGSNTTVNHSDHVHAMPGAFVAAGGSHAAGFVPDPGVTTHTPEKVLTESGWNVLPAHASTHVKGGADEVEVEDLATDITDTTLVLAPDGAGGLAFRAETGGGGGGGTGGAGVVGTAVFSATGGTIGGATYAGIISSVTRVSAGVYTVNLSPTQTDPYAVAISASDDNTNVMTVYIHGTTLGSSSFQFATVDPTGTPAARDCGVITVALMQVPSASRVVFQDNFNRANAGSVGAPQIGDPPFQAANWGITSNQLASQSSASESFVLWDATQLTYEITLTLAQLFTDGGPIVWINGTTGDWYLIDAPNGTSHYTLYQRASGYTLRQTGAGAAPADGDQLRIVVSGTRIRVYINGSGTPELDYTTADHPVSTLFGFREDSGTRARVEDLSVTVPS